MGAVRSTYLTLFGLLSCTDPQTEVPPIGLLPFRSRRALPYLYSEEDIVRLMDAAGAIESPYSLQPWTYRCLFGLLAVSGMRLGEALNLPCDAVDWSKSLLTIRGAKFGKSRLVPLHASRLTALRDYAERRDRKFAKRPVSYFFVTSCGTRLENTNVNAVFRTCHARSACANSALGMAPDCMTCVTALR